MIIGELTAQSSELLLVAIIFPKCGHIYPSLRDNLLGGY